MAEYTKQEIEEIVRKYTLNQQEYENVIRTVVEVMSGDKTASKSPLAIVVGGQSGAGKTALINYTSSFLSSNREFVVVDNDYFRAFHPMATEIRNLYPSLYTHITDQIGLGITSDIVSYFMGNDIILPSGNIIKNENHARYDLIFHQTLKSNRIADDAMAKLINAGYTVGVRAFAVPYFESKMSQLERCKEQFETSNFCRHVRPEDHYAALNGIPKTLEYIERNGKADFIEIFRRSDDIRCPELVYAKINPDRQEKTLSAISDCENVIHEDKTFGFDGAKDALIKTWELESHKCAKTLESRLNDLKADGGDKIPGMQEHITELEENLAEYLNTNETVFPPFEEK